MDNDNSSWLAGIENKGGAAAFGLEMQLPWSRHLLEGRKTIEVRNYELHEALVGTKIYILESQQGSDGISGLGNRIEIIANSSSGVGGAGGASIVGWCIFDSIQNYTSQTDFEADEGRHLVSPNSGYAWQTGTTSILYGWVVKECGCYYAYDGDGGRDDESEAITFKLALRRKRSIFELLESRS